MIYIAVLLACVAGALGAALVASRSALRTASAASPFSPGFLSLP